MWHVHVTLLDYIRIEHVECFLNICYTASGIEIHHSNGLITRHGRKTPRCKLHSFRLREGEVITHMDMSQGTWGGRWSLHLMTFFTSTGRTLGPYGGRGNYTITVKHTGYWSSPKFGFLSSLKRLVVIDPESLPDKPVTWVEYRFVWTVLDCSGSEIPDQCPQVYKLQWDKESKKSRTKCGCRICWWWWRSWWRTKGVLGAEHLDWVAWVAFQYFQGWGWGTREQEKECGVINNMINTGFRW